MIWKFTLLRQKLEKDTNRNRTTFTSNYWAKLTDKELKNLIIELRLLYSKMPFHFNAFLPTFIYWGGGRQLHQVETHLMCSAK